jgi:hypothetical protein
MVSLAEAFRTVRRALDHAGVTYAIGGSWASSVHGEPRHTNDIDFVANLDARKLRPFLRALGPGFYFDEDAALQALNHGRSFNVIHQTLGYKFDFFPVSDSHGDAELERRQVLPLPTLDTELVPVISAEDTILAKLRWYRAGGEVSDRQWRDIAGMFATSGEKLDRAYLERWAQALGLMDLYERAGR